MLLFAVSFLIIFAFSCSKDENPVEPKKIDEFALVTDAGDIYFTNYTTTTGGGMNPSIADMFVTLTDGNAANDPFLSARCFPQCRNPLVQLVMPRHGGHCGFTSTGCNGRFWSETLAVDLLDSF